MSLLLTLNIFHTCSSVSIVNFENVIASWVRDIAILNIKGSDYLCIISLISKNEAINLLQIADVTEKSGTL